MAEKIGSYGGVVTGVLGGLDQLGGGGTISRLLSKVPGIGGFFGGGAASTVGSNAVTGINAAGVPTNMAISSGVGAAPAGGLMSGMLGKALPIAGIAAGGYGLTKDRGLGKNMLNGATAGAGVGTMVGGPIGTAVGAGIGAGVGALRGIGGPSEAEKAGRGVGAQGVTLLGSTATPEQKQEAGNNPDALAHIIMRDRLAASGNSDPDAVAGQLLAAIKQAEKLGPDAVRQVIANIGKTLG